jgi:lipopolysaccharide biosynthesis glycosyltransferase
MVLSEHMGEETRRITLVTVCDNHFSMMLAALIKSIALNHVQPDAIDLYIVEDRMNSANRLKIKNTIEGSGIYLHWLRMSDVIDQRNLPLDASTFPLNVYVRLFIPHFLPKTCKKAIYLDVDMIVRTDLSALWDIDLNDHIIAGVPDRAPTVSTAWAGIQNYEALGLDPDTVYYNSGLLILDLEKWRESNLTQEIIDCILQNRQYAGFPDQYGLNVVLANKWLQLDSKWNTFAPSDERDPFIIHFIGRKPIYSSYDNNMQYKQEFLKYLSLTDFSGFKEQSEYMRFLKKLYNLLEKKVKTISIAKR